MTSPQAPAPLPGRYRRSATHARRRPSVGNILLGVIGETLITAGVIIGLFVVWQVYYTDVIGTRDAAEHISAFIAEAEEIPDAPAPERHDPTPEELPEGQFGILYVPRWGDDYQVPIAEGTGPEVIDNGYVGHYTTTQAPGEIGNFALAGHRQSRGKPFRYVEELREGDPLIVRTKEHFYVYRVTTDRIVYPHQIEVLDPNPYAPGLPAEVATMTLTTCHPLWQISERWIVHADLDYWTAVSDGYPEDFPERSR